METGYIPTKEKQDAYESIIPDLAILFNDYDNMPQEQREVALDEAIKLIRKINVLPVIYFNEEGIHKEIKSVIDENISFIDHELTSQVRNGFLLLDFIFDNLHNATTCNNLLSVRDRFYDDECLKKCIHAYLLNKKKIINMRSAYMSASRYWWDTPINFSPMRAKAIYNRFCPPGGTIYDYSAGYGARMLGALASDRNFKYIATDPNIATFKNLKILGKYIEDVTKRKNSYQVFNMPSQYLQLDKNSIDFCFSCPPFFKKEKYSNEDTQSIKEFPNYYDWLEHYVRPTIKNCYTALKDNCVYAVDIIDYFYMGKKITLVEDWIRIAEEEGFHFRDTYIIQSRFRKKTNETKEHLYIFTKTPDEPIIDYQTDKEAEAFEKRKADAQRMNDRRNRQKIAEYDVFGKLINIYNSYDELDVPIEIVRSKKLYIDKYYRIYRGDDIIYQSIEVKPLVAKIGDELFFSQSELARRIGVSKQAVSQSRQRNSTIINGIKVEWFNKE